MNVILWLQQPNMPLLNYAINMVGRAAQINFVGIYSPLETQGGGNKNTVINGKPVPLLDKKTLASTACDLIIFSGQNASVPTIINEAKAIGLDTTKLLFDWTTTVYGFSLERYRKLQRSQLSIISMGEFGARLSQLFGLSTPSIGIAASDRDFVNFLRDPLRHVTGELRSNVNWFNALVVMWTEDPKVLAEFDRLPFAKKVCFVPFETTLDSGFYIRPYYVGGKSLEQAVNNIASGNVVCFDLWNMLTTGMKTPINLLSKSNKATIAPGPHSHTGLNDRVHYFNFNESNYVSSWFDRFINAEIPGDKTFNFFSSFGDHRFVRQTRLERKVFYTGEEVFTWPWYDGYQDYCLPDVQLAMGGAYIKSPNYLRIPGWFVITLEPKLDMTSIKSLISEFNSSRSTKKYECVLINSHDMMNTRTPIYNQLKSVLEIRCPGKLFHNTDELQTVYGDNVKFNYSDGYNNNSKLRYVHEFIFNICPENCNHVGYVSEKLLESFRTGAIPIYYGSDNRPEPGIINPSAVLFFDPKSDNAELIKEVRRLKSDDAYYDKFMRQEKLFAKPAAEFIYSTLEELAKRLREMK